jgi:hypothetical protein
MEDCGRLRTSPKALFFNLSCPHTNPHRQALEGSAARSQMLRSPPPFADGPRAIVTAELCQFISSLGHPLSFVELAGEIGPTLNVFSSSAAMHGIL